MVPVGVLGFTNTKRGNRQRRQQLNKEGGKYRPEWAVAGSMLCEPASHLGVLRMTGFLGHLLPGLLLTGPAEMTVRRLMASISAICPSV